MKNKVVGDQKRYDEIRLLIKNYRINDGLNQKEFSKLAKIHENTLQKFESGKESKIMTKTLFALIDVTGLTLSEFFDGIN